MRLIGHTTITAVTALAFAASSTSGMASTVPSAGPQQARHPWVTLSMLTPAGANAMAGSAAVVAAQPDAVPPPQPVVVEDPGFHPPLAVIAIWLANIALMIYIATHDDDDDEEVGVSPT